MSETPSVSFRCFIAQMDSALKFGGDSARVTIEVPACDVAKAVEMIAFKGVPLKVRFEVDNDEPEVINDERRNAGKSTKIHI